MSDPRVYLTVVHAPDRGAQSVLGRLLLRQMVGRITELDDDQFCIAAEPSGRLAVTLKNAPARGIFVSLSHSGALLACTATSAGPIGIDLEKPRSDRNVAGIAGAAFGPAEIRRCADEGQHGFYRIWTLREAMAKATGHGLSSVCDRRDRAAEGPYQGCWRWQDWHLAHAQLPAGMSLGIAVLPQSEVAQLSWQAFTPDGAAALPLVDLDGYPIFRPI
jgi:4'-phosphopantetheinyl transferase